MSNLIVKTADVRLGSHRVKLDIHFEFHEICAVAMKCDTEVS